MADQGYDPITARQAVIASSFAGMDWYGNVVTVYVDEENGTVITDKDTITRDEFFRALRKVSTPDLEQSQV